MTATRKKKRRRRIIENRLRRWNRWMDQHWEIVHFSMLGYAVCRKENKVNHLSDWLKERERSTIRRVADTK